MTSSVVTDQIEATLQAKPTTQPANALCECQGCNGDTHDDLEHPCGNDAEYLMEFAGFSCAGCLPMMLDFGIANAEDQIEFDPASEPPNIRVANYHAGAPLFPKP